MLRTIITIWKKILACLGLGQAARWMTLALQFISSFQGPWGTRKYTLTHLLKKCIPGLQPNGSSKSTGVSTKLTWLRLPTWCRLLLPALALLLCSEQPQRVHPCLFCASRAQLLFYGGLAIWQGQLSKAVFLGNNTALKIPCFTLASRHTFKIVLDAHGSTTVPEGTSVLASFVVQGCGEQTHSMLNTVP